MHRLSMRQDGPIVDACVDALGAAHHTLSVPLELMREGRARSNNCVGFRIVLMTQVSI